MKKYIGKSGKSYQMVEPPMASGGEGNIYQVQDDVSVVAKIFKSEKLTSLQRSKIELMALSPHYDAVDQQTTWPQDLLYENEQGRADQKPVGYIMKKVESGEMLCDINGPEFSTIKWIYKLGIACNLCSAVAAVHAIGHVVGDLNPRNILISRKNLMVTLIDTDSYDVKDVSHNKEYRCGVGMGEYIAPELLKRLQQGERLDSLALPTFTEETDNFALAIHIFSLLMDGYHPFTCRVLDTAPESTPYPKKKDSIVSGFSPYFSSKENLDIPLHAPKLSRLPQNIQELFRKAFVDGYNNPKARPSAEVWGNELRALYYEKKQEAAQRDIDSNGLEDDDNQKIENKTDSKGGGCLSCILIVLIAGWLLATQVLPTAGSFLEEKAINVVEMLGEVNG